MRNSNICYQALFIMLIALAAVIYSSRMTVARNGELIPTGNDSTPLPLSYLTEEEMGLMIAGEPCDGSCSKRTCPFVYTNCDGGFGSCGVACTDKYRVSHPNIFKLCLGSTGPGCGSTKQVLCAESKDCANIILADQICASRVCHSLTYFECEYCTTTGPWIPSYRTSYCA